MDPNGSNALGNGQDMSDGMRAVKPKKPLTQQEVMAAQKALCGIVDNIETVICGKREIVELVVLALIARGHVLLEDLPGTGKTTLASMLAKSISCGYSRIQFTPDVMPSDVSGFSIFNQKTNEFEFRPGGVMSNLVLADEINRASAKTQSALLEAMEERQVTVDGTTYLLREPFMVIATQNPIEQSGTYPLPEAQLDRFMIKISMGYPNFNDEVNMLALEDDNKKALGAVVSANDILSIRDLTTRVHVSDAVLHYIVGIVNATRSNPLIQVGSSPRGALALKSFSRAYALMHGRNYVLPDDVKGLASYVLSHRLTLSYEATAQGWGKSDVIASILSGIAVPMPA